MLKRVILGVILALFPLVISTPEIAYADTCKVEAFGQSLNSGVSASCQTQSQGSTNQGTQNSSDGPSCFSPSGEQIACWVDGFYWNAALGYYCVHANDGPDSLRWDGHRDSQGNPIGTLYYCTKANGWKYFLYIWAPGSPQTPDLPGVDVVGLVRTAVASLHLKSPTVGVGAFTYRGYEQWGLTWWVGAPMWLLVGPDDPLQWGTHTLSASEGGVSVTATVTATRVSFDPGDGSTAVTCKKPGTLRPWLPDDPLDHHSPSGCEHTYLHTNELGNPDSRFEVSATVTWTVTWTATTGQAGTFTLTTTSSENPTIHVGELRVVRVPNPDEARRGR